MASSKAVSIEIKNCLITLDEKRERNDSRIQANDK